MTKIDIIMEVVAMTVVAEAVELMAMTMVGVTLLVPVIGCGAKVKMVLESMAEVVGVVIDYDGSDGNDGGDNDSVDGYSASLGSCGGVGSGGSGGSDSVSDGGGDDCGGDVRLTVNGCSAICGGQFVL